MGLKRGSGTANLGSAMLIAEDDDSYGEHRQFTVAVFDDARLPVLKRYLARLAAKLDEGCIYPDTGATVSLI
jgi:hypothetical protein